VPSTIGQAASDELLTTLWLTLTSHTNRKFEKISKQLQTETMLAKFDSRALFQSLTTGIIWNRRQWKWIFCISQGSAVTLFRWEGQVYNFLMWNYTSNY